MSSRSTVAHSSLFRLITIFSSGFGAASLSLWAVMMNQLDAAGASDFNAISAIIAGLSALAGAGCAHAYFIGSDEASKVYEAALATDSATGLLSREGLEKAITGLEESGESHMHKLMRWMLVSIEVDTFRDINQVHGAETGDEILRYIGDRIRRLVGDLGPVARITGSEFAFAFQVSHDERELHAVMTAVLEEMARPIRLGHHVIPIFCTAGLVELGPENRSMATALRRTNLARSNARAGGLGNWAIYHPEMTRSDTYRKWIESELAKTVHTRDFELVYQPQVQSISGKVVGYEALLRWNHPEKGYIPPSEFISVAEKCGLIGQIGMWVLKRVCEDIARFPPDVTIAVNVSPKQLEYPDFVARFSEVMRAHDVSPKRIELEVTENILILDHFTVRRKFQEIRDLGCAISIDDFGTGYSNLGYLTELPFTKLKLDQSLVARIGEHENGAAVISTVVNLGHALGVSVLAEGVETEAQKLLLEAAGCTLMQGYYFGKPVAIEDTREEHDEPERVLA